MGPKGLGHQSLSIILSLALPGRNLSLDGGFN